MHVDFTEAVGCRTADVAVVAPPLLPVTDAAVLGTICSGVLMVVHSNSTRREQLARAVATVNAVGATVLGTILNMVPTRGPDAYGYGYGYEYGGRYESKRRFGRLGADEVPLGSQRSSALGRAGQLRRDDTDAVALPVHADGALADPPPSETAVLAPEREERNASSTSSEPRATRWNSRSR